MTLTYRTKRRLYRAGLIGGILLLVAILVAFCWVIWLERYVVYTRDGATLNLDLVDTPSAGQLSSPPIAGETVPIYVNEGLDAINLTSELAQIKGYYIDTDTLQSDVAAAREMVATLPSGTAVMVELKSIWGYTVNEVPNTIIVLAITVVAVLKFNFLLCLISEVFNLLLIFS